MSISVHFKRTLGLGLTLALAVPQLALAQSVDATKVIFPGQALPADLGYTPLTIGSGADVDVQVQPRDWFLLKDKDMGLISPTAGKTLDYVGPVLEAQNAQIYYRLITGMILKESMVQAGFSASEARHLIESSRNAGQNFSSTPLAQMGPLPKGLANLYENWNRPMARMAVLPYLLLPLAIANDQSQFQHFFQGSTEDSSRAMSCSNIQTLPPLAAVQSKISDAQKKMQDLDLQLRDANSLLQASGSEQVRISDKIKAASDTITQQLQCLTTIRDRVARGAAMPDDACLNLAKAIMLDGGFAKEWDSFTNVNLKNPDGDFNQEQKLDAQFTALEGQIAATQALQRQTQQQSEEIQQEISANKAKIDGLNSDLEKEKTNLAMLVQDQQKLDAEILAIQDLNHKIETGALAKEQSDTDVKAAVDNTSTRNAQLQDMKSKQTQTVENRAKIETNMASMTTQIEFLKTEIDKETVQANANNLVLNDKVDGLNVKLAGLQADQEKLKPIYTAALDAANFSDYILSLLTKTTASLSSQREQMLADLSHEQENSVNYKKQLAEVQAAKDAQFPDLQQSNSALQNMIAAYTDVQNMGWFLETDCAARKTFGASPKGIFLSRDSMAPAATPATKNNPAAAGGPVEAGRWGLFNTDYKRFQAAIQSGVLLNLPGYVQTSVQQLIADYDSAMVQYLDPSIKKCADASQNLAAAPLSVMRAVSTSWQKSAAISMACATPLNNKGVVGALTKESFTTSLNKLLAFQGSTLDQALPQEGRSQAEDLIERHAISLLAREIATMSGETRRDELIKALIQVLAYDYDAAALQQRTQAAAQGSANYVFATNAPGPAAATDANQLQVGKAYSVRTLGKVILYTSPIAKSEYDSGASVSLNDQVQVLAIENETATDVAGWAHVQVAGKALWMPSLALRSSGLLGEDGQVVADLTLPSNCPQPHLVQSLTNFKASRVTVSRYSNNLKTVSAGKKAGYWMIDLNKSEKVAPANTKKTYIACENFVVAGQTAMVNVAADLQNQNGTDFSATQAVRLIEVRPMTAANGTMVYIPLEAVGGFVPAWAFENLTQPRLVIGPALDSTSWSLVK